MANFPLIQSAPVGNPMTYGNPANAFSYVQSAVMNANGIVAAIDDAGVNGHYRYRARLISPSRMPNGSWGTPVGI